MTSGKPEKSHSKELGIKSLLNVYTILKSMKLLINICILLFSISSLSAQVDTLNTESSALKMSQLPMGESTYLVYIQDSIDGPKYKTEIWDRTITKNGNGLYQFNWKRHFPHKTYYDYEIIANSTDFSPISERVVEHKEAIGDSSLLKKLYLYQNQKLLTHKDTSQHNDKPFRLDDLSHSFNWEMDMETFSMLPLEDGKKFWIKFYHPGSKTPPQYYQYEVDRSETLSFNGLGYDCWVLRIEYSKQLWTEFWIDKTTFKTLKMKEAFFGRYRFKVLVI